MFWVSVCSGVFVVGDTNPHTAAAVGPLRTIRGASSSKCAAEGSPGAGTGLFCVCVRVCGWVWVVACSVYCSQHDFSFL